MTVKQLFRYLESRLMSKAVLITASFNPLTSCFPSVICILSLLLSWTVLDPEIGCTTDKQFDLLLSACVSLSLHK